MISIGIDRFLKYFDFPGASYARRTHCYQTKRQIDQLSSELIMTHMTRTRQNGQLESLERRDLLSATPQLVGDLNAAPPAPKLQADNVWLGDEVFFAADDGSGDVELWKSNGTASGTVRVKDIRAGAEGSLPRDLSIANGRVLFTAYTEQFGRELWTTDGTEQGTILFKDLVPGAASHPIDSFTSVGDNLYFRLAGALWVTDGTSSGTKALTTTEMHRLTPVGQKLFLTSYVGIGNPKLWVSDGTQEGTTLLSTDIDPHEFASAGEFTIMASHGSLWRSDGTSQGTVKIKEFADARIGSMTSFGGEIFFANLSDVSFDGELWKSDGTSEGTQPVKSFSFGGIGSPWVVGDKMMFLRGRGNTTEIWSSDGTSEGTQRVASFRRADLELIGTARDRSYFTVDDTLWQSDGTADGTMSVFENQIQNISQVREVDGAIYLFNSRDDGGQELWRIDRTEAEVQLIDVAPGPASSAPWVMASHTGKTLFWSTSGEAKGLWGITQETATPTLLNDAIFGPSAGIVGTFESLNVVEVEGKALIERVGAQLWESDGVNSIPIDPTLPERHSSNIVGEHQYFFQVDELDGRAELWRTDGSYTETIRLTDTDDVLYHPSGLTDAGGKLFFWAEDADAQMKLWSFDEDQSNLEAIQDLHGTSERALVSLKEELFFSHKSDEHSDTELWKVDNTSERAERVTVIPGSGVNLLAAEDQIFIEVSYDTPGPGTPGLYRTDGTAEGTYALYTEGYNDRTLAILGNQMFFVGYSNEAGDELWVSDGTVAGTKLVKDIVPGRQGCGLANMVAVGDTLYFGATDSEGNAALWKSDGTAYGTVPIFDNPAYPIASGDGVVYFNGDDPSSGGELWMSDGTQRGTVQVADLNPGSDGSRKYPSAGTAIEINGRLIFAGNDGFHGYELWQVPLDSLELPMPGDANRDGVFNSSDLVQVFQRGEYEDEIIDNSTWEDGDWNGDGDFTTADLVLAFQSGGYQAAAVIHDRGSLFDWTDHSNRRMKKIGAVIDEVLEQDSFQK